MFKHNPIRFAAALLLLWLWATAARADAPVTPPALGAEINVGQILKANQYQTDLRCDPTNAANLTVTAKINAGETETAAFSTRDAGQTWSVTTQAQSSDPDVVYDNRGVAFWSFIDLTVGKRNSVRRSRNGRDWDAPRVITKAAVDHAHLAVDRGQSAWGGSVYLAGRNIGAPVITVVRSRDGGETWAETQIPVAGTIGLGFVDGPPRVLRDGTLIVFAKSFNQILVENDHYAGARARAYILRSTDGGLTFAPPILVREINTPANAGPGGARGFAATGGFVAGQNLERLYLVSCHEIQNQPGVLQLCTSDDGGLTWSAPRAITSALPDNRGAGALSLVTNARGTLGIQFFGVGSDGQYDLYFIASVDGGASFSPPLRVSGVTSSAPAQKSQPRELGGDQVACDADAKGQFQLVWADNRNGDDFYSIYTRAVAVLSQPN